MEGDLLDAPFVAQEIVGEIVVVQTVLVGIVLAVEAVAEAGWDIVAGIEVVVEHVGIE